MILKWILFGLMSLSLLYKVVTYQIIWKQRKKPLPKEVSDIYDAKRYQQFIEYKKDYRISYFISIVVPYIYSCCIIFSDFYCWIDRLTDGNVYMIFLLTFLIQTVLETLFNLMIHYYDTFYIEEKYGLNKKDKKEFFKDFGIDFLTNQTVLVCFIFLIIFICEHLGKWTNNFQFTYIQALLICIAIAAVFASFMLFASLISLFALKKQYTFTELEDGELKDKINELQKNAKKQVKHIQVYDESKKSNSKNAFLLKLLWHREFGIADNFLNENSMRELLAVLSHEIGHLKHQKNIFNYARYVLGIFFVLLLAWLLSHIQILLNFNQWINQSFSLQYNNYYLMMLVITNLLNPLLSILIIFRNYVSRLEEKEADYHAVDQGYGQELITTFKNVSSDELMDVNPSSIIEFLEYDHPGMYQRIKYIEERIKYNENRKEDNNAC